MHIGINALFQAGGGSLTHLDHLLREWDHLGVLRSHSVTLFASGTTRDRLGADLPKGVAVIPYERADRGLLGRLWVEQRILPAAVRAAGVDVLYCPGNTVPLTGRIPCVVSFQNAAPFCPHGRRSVSWGQRRKWDVLGYLMRRSAEKAARVVFISAYFRELFLRHCPIEPAKCCVVYRTAKQHVSSQCDETLEVRYGLSRPYLLTVSHVYPYKNLVEVVDGYRQAVAGVEGRRSSGETSTLRSSTLHSSAPPLVIAGRTDIFPRYTERLRRHIADAGLTEHVRLIGPVPQRDVQALIAGCEVFVFSSTCENCPTGLIEALAVGKPIACSNVGVMPEIGSDAAEYFDPYRPDEFAGALARLSDPHRRAELSARARRRAAAFPTPAESARQILAVLEDAAATSSLRQKAA